MDKKEYYTQLFSLFEASNNQAEIATDNNVDQVPIDNEEIDSTNSEEQVVPEEGMDDAAYLQGNLNPEPQTTPSEALELEKSHRLFKLFNNLLNYSDLFGKSLGSIDTGLIDETKLDELDTRKYELDKVKEKVETYLKNQFNGNKYEKNLYLYVLLRTELLAIIKAIRDLLGLNSNEMNN